MPKISRSALLEVSAELAYEVVKNVEAYPEFLPGCERVEVLSRSGDGTDDGTDEGIEAKVSVSGAGMKQSFVTANRHSADHITMSLVTGPFKSLEGLWQFVQLGERGCKVQVHLEFEVDGVLGVMFTPIADVVANKLVDAFCQRMDELQARVAE